MAAESAMATEISTVAEQLLGGPTLLEDPERLESEMAKNRTKVELGLAFRAKELADRIRTEKERREAIVEAYEAGIKQLEARLALIGKMLGMSLEYRVKHEGHPKTISVPGAGVLRQRTIKQHWKVTDPEKILEWCEENNFAECVKPTLRTGAVQDQAKDLMARAGGEIPAGLTDVPERESTKFTAEGH